VDPEQITGTGRMSRTQLRCIAEFKFVSVDAAGRESHSFHWLVSITTDAPTIPLANWNQCFLQVAQKAWVGYPAGGPSGLVDLVGYALMPNVV
jgi:hypothetical protein